MIRSCSPESGSIRNAARRQVDAWRALPIAMLLSIAALTLAALWTAHSTAAGQAPAPVEVLRIYGVGGVLTADGTLWQYRPETKKWLTIDEAFREQGKTTQVLPLPVRAREIREMVTFGFLLSESGECWLYDLERNRWERLPPRQR